MTCAPILSPTCIPAAAAKAATPEAARTTTDDGVGFDGTSSDASRCAKDASPSALCGPPKSSTTSSRTTVTEPSSISASSKAYAAIATNGNMVAPTTPPGLAQMDGRHHQRSKLNASANRWLSSCNGRLTMPATKTSDELCDRIARVIRTDDDPTDVFNALVDCYAFQMSLLTCPDCRKQAARALAQTIPAMLEHADALAAEYAMHADAQEPSVQAHMCH